MQLLVILIIMSIVSSAWWPAHKFFTFLRKYHHSRETLILAIMSLIIINILLIYVGLSIGGHIHNLAIRSLDTVAAGSYTTVNLFWIPFTLIGLGLWAGLLSGYAKMKVINN